MNIKSSKTVKRVMSQEMSRKDFLKHFGVGTLVVLGGGTLLQALFENGISNKRQHATSYGSNVYGGYDMSSR